MVNLFLTEVFPQLSVNEPAEQVLVVIVVRAYVLLTKCRNFLHNEVKITHLKLVVVDGNFLHITEDFLVQRGHHNSHLHIGNALLRLTGHLLGRVAKIRDHGLHFLVQ